MHINGVTVKAKLPFGRGSPHLLFRPGELSLRLSLSAVPDAHHRPSPGRMPRAPVAGRGHRPRASPRGTPCHPYHSAGHGGQFPQDNGQCASGPSAGQYALSSLSAPNTAAEELSRCGSGGELPVPRTGRALFSPGSRRSDPACQTLHEAAWASRPVSPRLKA